MNTSAKKMTSRQISGKQDARGQLLREIQRLELQLSRLKGSGHFFEDSAIPMYEEMLAARRAMLAEI